MKEKRYLLLENGAYFEGYGFGAETEDVIGEVVFTTGMTGYLETITDPSYYGQIVVQTFPMIGNYGVISQDFEHKDSALSAYIVSEWCQEPSNFRSKGNLDTFFQKQGIPAVAGVDTRSLVKMLRDHGTMNGKLTKKAPPYEESEFAEIWSYRITDAVEHVTPKEMEVFSESTTEPLRVVLWDFGAKDNIVRELLAWGCEVIDMPAFATAEEILAVHPDGIMLSNGPGDPEANVGVIEELKKVAETKLPIFGICLGHQLFALAMGAKTGKMKYGHRGANQPVKEVESGKIYITSQNHGYEVLTSTLPEFAKEAFYNVNDRTCEGIRYLDRPALTVQFHPEACAGPRDAKQLFQTFRTMMEEYKGGA